MKKPQDAVSARELFASIRSENPAIAQVERQMGSRLTVARNVLRLRVRVGMKQTELAQRAGLSQPRIAEIEAGRVNTTVDTLDKLARAFSVPAAALLKIDEVAATRREETITVQARPAVTKGWGRGMRTIEIGRPAHEFSSPGLANG